MSFMNLEDLSDRELVAQYILQQRQKGFCLSYSEYELVERWLDAAERDSEALLLILQEVLSKPRLTSSRPMPLQALHKTVLKRLKELRPRGDA